ncbi:MAG: UvrD-helicase domain-containing protein, partial [Bacteroidales bacterium]|nr:UvrD-helicase domain-containing protein [Bacteroidales bacterium]
MFDYLKDLNKIQYDAVVNTEGPALVIAGAGSGKTRVLTYRIAHLLRKEVRPSSILALTFTNKAAREMKERIAGVVGENMAGYLWMGTFHSIFARILRIEHEATGYPHNFTIFDAADSKNLIKSVIKSFRFDEKVYKPGIVASRISMAKNSLVTPVSYAQNIEITSIDSSMKMPAISEIYREYAKRSFLSGAMDFDDLLLKTNQLFNSHPGILEKYRERFSYILVDEYQDTNYSQYLIVKKLAKRYQNLCVVGDDAQSIYSFRGARIENILSFQQDYPNHKIFKLEQNYRSTKTIVNAANSVIAKNRRQIPKTVYSQKETGRPIKVISALTDNEEGFLVAREIAETQLRDHHKNMDYAILYRTNA